MKSYKLIKEYPGSPQLGKVIASTTHEWMTVQPQKFPEFWKEVDPMIAVKSKDGVDIYEGEMCWRFNTNCTLSHFIVNEYYLRNGVDGDVFSSREAAEAYLISEINIPLEDCVLLGCNVPLYSLLPKANWDEKETTSLELWIRMKMGRNTTNWKYFRSKEARDVYIKAHKPEFSQEQVMQACKENEISMPVCWDIINSLRKMS